MSIVLVGISHHEAPVELRERAALDPTRAGELARTLAAGGSEAVCLSTCNRTELYLADESAEAAERKRRRHSSRSSPTWAPRSIASATKQPRCISFVSPPGSTR